MPCFYYSGIIEKQIFRRK